MQLSYVRWCLNNVRSAGEAGEGRGGEHEMREGEVRRCERADQLGGRRWSRADLRLQEEETALGGSVQMPVRHERVGPVQRDSPDGRLDGREQARREQTERSHYKFFEHDGVRIAAQSDRIRQLQVRRFRHDDPSGQRTRVQGDTRHRHLPWLHRQPDDRFADIISRLRM